MIGLGANLGDRRTTLEEATRRIAAAMPILARSRLWETAPVGGPPQPHFLNAALLVAWHATPHALLDLLLGIEADLGRVRGGRAVMNGPRTIDLDVLWIEGRVVDDAPRLVVPHPRLAVRAFALAPMLEVIPGAADPRTGEAYVVPNDQGVQPLGEA